MSEPRAAVIERPNTEHSSVPEDSAAAGSGAATGGAAASQAVSSISRGCLVGGQIAGLASGWRQYYPDSSPLAQVKQADAGEGISLPSPASAALATWISRGCRVFGELFTGQEAKCWPTFVRSSNLANSWPPRT